MNERHYDAYDLFVCRWQVFEILRRRNASGVEAGNVQRCDREDGKPATVRCPDGRRSVDGLSPVMEREHSLGLRVGLRIRCAGRVKADESRGGCKVVERRFRLANAEGATAAVMQYGCQRGKIFEGCETR
jgi:hypothetical protein